MTAAARLLLALGAFAWLARSSAALAQESERGEELYRQSRFQEAYDAFQARIESEGGSPALEYNAGNSLYRLGRIADALRSFRRALEGASRGSADAADSADVRQRSLYNLGTAFARQAEGKDYKYEDLKNAARAYEDALVLRPDDADAKWNLEIILRKLALPGNGPRTMATRGGAQWRGGNLTKSGYPGTETGYGAATGGGFGASQGESVRRMSESEARQLLQTVRQEQEKSGGLSRNEDSAPRTSAGKPDW